MASNSDTPQATGRPFLYYDEKNGQKTFGWLTPKAAAIRSAEIRTHLRKKEATKGDYARLKEDWKKRNRPSAKKKKLLE